MKCPLSRADKKQIGSVRIVKGIFAIGPWLLLLAAGHTSTYAQTSDDLSSTTSSSAADWVEFHRDNMKRWNPYETKLGVGSPPTSQWTIWETTRHLFGLPSSSPAVGIVRRYATSFPHTPASELTFGDLSSLTRGFENHAAA